MPVIPANLDRAASAELDGVRVTIKLERNPMPAGEPTWLTTTVMNIGRDEITYEPCGEAVMVEALIGGVPWRAGRDLPNPAATWKTYLLYHRADTRVIRFLLDGQTGVSSGCGDIHFDATLAPGATHKERMRWDGLSFRQFGPPPTARIDLVGSFPFYRGRPLDEPPAEARRTLDVHVDAWIADPSGGLLDPAEAADVALTDPRLTELLASRDLYNGNEGIVRYDPGTGLYHVGMLESGNLPVARVHVVLVDPRTGANVGWVERDWDYVVDGFP